MIRIPGLRAPLNREHFRVGHARLRGLLRGGHDLAPDPAPAPVPDPVPDPGPAPAPALDPGPAPDPDPVPAAPAAVASPRQGVDRAYLGNNIAVVRTHRGHKMLVDTRDMALTPHLLMDGYWERHVEDVVHRLLKPGSIAVEVGSNFGYHTLHMAQRIGSDGKLHAFEANPEIVELLKHTVSLSGYGDIIDIRPVAASDQNGTASFDFAFSHNGAGHLTVGSLKPVERRITVQTARIDDVLATVPAIDMLRMDAEGSEPLILAGAWRLIDRSPAVVIVTEWFATLMALQGADAAVLARQLYGRGFKSWLIDSSARLVPVDVVALSDAVHDVVFCRELPQLG